MIFKFKENAKPICLPDGFWYSLFEGGYLQPSNYLEGTQLQEIYNAMQTLESFQRQMKNADLLKEC